MKTKEKAKNNEKKTKMDFEEFVSLFLSASDEVKKQIEDILTASHSIEEG